MLRSVSASSGNSSWSSQGSVAQLPARIARQPALDVGPLFQSLWGYLRYLGAPQTAEIPLEKHLKNRVTVSMWLGESHVDSRIKAPWKRFLLTGSSDGRALEAVHRGLREVSSECIDAELSSLRALLAVFVGQPLRALEDREGLVGEIQDLFTFLPGNSPFRRRWDKFYSARLDHDSILLPQIFRLRELFQEVCFPDPDDSLFLSDSDSSEFDSDSDAINSTQSSNATSSPSSEPSEVFGPDDSFVVSPDSSTDAASAPDEASLPSNRGDAGTLSVIDEEDETESESSDQSSCSTILEADEDGLPLRSASHPTPEADENGLPARSASNEK
jgi:hypothetical protein